MGKVIAQVSREVRFSFDTDEQKAEFEAYAKAHGMSLAGFVKWATFAMRARNRTGSHHGANGSGRTSAPLDKNAIHGDT